MYFIYGLIIALLFRQFVLTWNNRTKKETSGYLILKLPKFYGYIGVIGLAGVIGVGASALEQLVYQGFPSIELMIAIVIMLIVFAGLGVLLILQTWVFEIRVNEQEIIQRSRMGKETSVQWTEVKDVKFSSLSLELAITDGVKKVKCHQHSVGFEKLIEQIKLKVNLDIQQLRLPEF